MPREIRGLGVVVIFLLQCSLAWVPWRVRFNQGGSFAKEFSEGTGES